MIAWEQQPTVPRGVAAILSGGCPGNDADWDEALTYADRFQLTLQLTGAMPARIRERIERDRVRNGERIARMLRLFAEVAEAAGGIEFAVLKGFAHWGIFPGEPANRIQFDLDLYCPEEAPALRAVLRRFAPAPGYKWNGDYYDPAIPIEIDFHEKLWDETMEGFSAPGVERFWSRRVRREVSGVRFQTLAPADALAYSAVHMLKHILHGDARPAQALEIAAFLRHHAGDAAFWAAWRDLHPPELRRLEAIAFRFAAEWFGCPVPKEELPARVERWFQQYAASPITSFFRPNKDELALNLCLIEGGAAKARVIGRRLFPARWPRPFSYALARAVFHLRALAPAVSTMLRMRR